MATVAPIAITATVQVVVMVRVSPAMMILASVPSIDGVTVHRVVLHPIREARPDVTIATAVATPMFARATVAATVPIIPAATTTIVPTMTAMAVADVTSTCLPMELRAMMAILALRMTAVGNFNAREAHTVATTETTARTIRVTVVEGADTPTAMDRVATMASIVR